MLIAAGLHPEAVRYNWRVFLIALGAAVVLLVYLWVNPMFLPMSAFAGGSFRVKHGRTATPKSKQEQLEVDALLEKVSRDGMQSLTAQERAFLEGVSRKYQRRAESKKPQSGLTI